MLHRCLVILMSTAAILGLTACAAPARQLDRATFGYTPLKGDPQVVFTTSNELVLIDVTSPTGIGSVAIEKTSGEWPPKVMIRLHVKGLENFKFTYGAKTVEAAVSSQNAQLVREVLAQAGKASTLSAGDPYWMSVTRGRGYFDIEVPADFLASGESKFTIEWIDYYR